MAVTRHFDQDLKLVLDDWKKMAFVSGPRQVGKTTLAKGMLKHRPGVYFNWDISSDRKKLVRQPHFFEHTEITREGDPLVVLDELHKYGRWKNYLKGVFDGFGDRFRFLVTGSGRLDVFKKGGDSLLGRYVPLVLFPLTVGELHGPRGSWTTFLAALDHVESDSKSAQDALTGLLRFGGFPEPLSRGSDAFYNTWNAGRTERLVREDIRDATALRDLSLVESLAYLLPERIGSPLSINSLREDLGVAFETVKSWLNVLEAFHYVFRLAPWSKKVARALRKENKVYLWDWAELDNAGARFENLVALHLLKATRTWTAVGEAKLDLHYARDKEKREVDFVLTEKGKPKILIECKLSDTELSPQLLRFQAVLDVPTVIQLVRTPGYARRTSIGGRTQWVVSADRWLTKLP